MGTNFDTLEVGGYYKNRLGDVWFVKSVREDQADRFFATSESHGAHVFTADGNYWADFSGSPNDLVERVNADGSPYGTFDVEGYFGREIYRTYDRTSLGSMINEVRRLSGSGRVDYGAFLRATQAIPIHAAYASATIIGGDYQFISSDPNFDATLYYDLEAYHDTHKILTEVTDFG